MSDTDGAAGSVRTVLEQRIRERRQTFEEFAEYAEQFARQHDEVGTLSVRHLQRLVTGRQSVDSLRPATARLLERIFDMRIAELLAPPVEHERAGSQSQVRLDIDAELGLGDSKVRSGRSTAHALRVAVAVVVKELEVLLVCRRSDESGGIAWQFPAGIIKPGMSAETVARWETAAETGVHCSVVRTLGSRVHPVTHVVCDYVLCEYLTGDVKNIDVVENIGVAWVSKHELARFIPTDQVYVPVLDALSLTSPYASSAS